jgi:hypothetical protein
MSHKERGFVWNVDVNRKAAGFGLVLGIHRLWLLGKGGLKTCSPIDLPYSSHRLPHLLSQLPQHVSSIHASALLTQLLQHLL